MAQKRASGGESYKEHADSLKAGKPESLYIYHGDERYLRDSCLGELRRRVCPDGTGGFNYRRYDGRNLSVDELEDAVNTYPVFAERTLVELHDYDIFDNEEKLRLAVVFSGLPDYVCVVIVFDTIPYRPDGRQKADKEILKNARVVEFSVQDQSMLVKWITRHFRDAGKSIRPADAEYLVHITGGYMATLDGEIEKTAAYAAGETVTRADIDAVVTPVLDAVIFKLTDAIIRRDNSVALRVLDELLRMRETPQLLIYSISLKMRQFLAARVCIDSKAGVAALIGICGIKHEFQARMLMDTARKTTRKRCCESVLLCSDTAYALNSAPEPEARLTEFIVKLMFCL